MGEGRSDSRSAYCTFCSLSYLTEGFARAWPVDAHVASSGAQAGCRASTRSCGRRGSSPESSGTSRPPVATARDSSISPNAPVARRPSAGAREVVQSRLHPAYCFLAN